MSLARVAFIGLKEKSRDIAYFDDNGKPFEQVANLAEAQSFKVVITFTKMFNPNRP